MNLIKCLGGEVVRLTNQEARDLKEDPEFKDRIRQSRYGPYVKGYRREEY